MPAIISTGASPTDCEPPQLMVDLKTPLPARRQGRPAQKLTGGEQLSLDMDTKLSLFSDRNQCSQQQPHQMLPHWQTNSEESAYCAKCGGVTSHERRNFAKKRYFSLDKERNEKSSNFLHCLTMTCADTGKCVSDNILASSLKQSSFEAISGDKCTGKPRATNASNNNVSHDINNVINVINNITNTSNGSKSFLPTIRQTCEKCDTNAPHQIKSKGSAKSGVCLKNGTQRTECTTSCSNRSFKDKSNKSSQNSLRESRTSRKNSCMQLNASEASGCGGGAGDRSKPKRISSQHSRKTSTRATSLNMHEEQDSETREILLGTTTTTSHSKFDKLPDIKIPEPVEAVCSFVTHSLFG